MCYDLVIFDNDGVLVDSEPISNTILAGYLTELGHPTSYEESLRDYMGAAVHRVHDLVRERTGQVLPADFDETLHARVLPPSSGSWPPSTARSRCWGSWAAGMDVYGFTAMTRAGKLAGAKGYFGAMAELPALLA